MEKAKRSISEKINARFSEPDDGIFKDGKWRWWFALVFGLSLGSAIVTALIFSGSFGALAVGMGLLILWTLVGTLVYSDSRDVRLARGVSILDSVALCFVVAHFCFAMWVYGHMLTLQSADAKYEAQVVDHNARAERIQAGDLKKTELEVAIAKERTKAAKIENDTAYQTRKAAERGAVLRVGGARNQSDGGQLPALPVMPIEIQKPVAPAESAAAFLSRWDTWIRWANFGELILAAVTLIYIRNRSAKINALGAALPVATVSQRQIAAIPALRQGDSKRATPVATQAQDWRELAVKALREHLGEIAYYLPERWFKADLRPAGGVWIRLYERREGREEIVAKTKQSDKLLRAIDRPDFRERLIAELKYQKFPIGD